MKNIIDYNFDVHSIDISCYVAPGCGAPVHKNRSSHGIAFHPNGIKNSKSISSKSCFLNSAMSPFINGFKKKNFILLIDFINLSYIPVINAIVPPEIPGIMSHIPIRNPLRNIFIMSNTSTINFTPMYYVLISVF